MFRPTRLVQAIKSVLWSSKLNNPYGSDLAAKQAVEQQVLQHVNKNRKDIEERGASVLVI
ncbi:hypothetical protein DACRYDRAFT_22142, partial [Dacryopinax primogenitus]